METTTVFRNLTIDQATLITCLYRLRKAREMARTQAAKQLIQSSIEDMEACLPVHMRRDTRYLQEQRIAKEAHEAKYKKTAGDSLPF